MKLNKLSPKLMLKVQLINDDKIDFELILLNAELIRGHINYFYSRYSLFFMYFTELNNFKINTETYTVVLPKNFNNKNRLNNTLKFKNNDERYKFLKSFKNLLLEWSDSILWKENPNKPKISYNGNIWILF